MAKACFQSLPLELVRLVFQEVLDSNVDKNWKRLWRLRLVNRMFAVEIRQLIFDLDIFFPFETWYNTSYQIRAEYLNHLVHSQKKIGAQLRRTLLGAADFLLQYQPTTVVPHDQRVWNTTKLLCEAHAILTQQPMLQYRGWYRDQIEDYTQSHAQIWAVSCDGTGDGTLGKLLGLRFLEDDFDVLFGPVLRSIAKGGVLTINFTLPTTFYHLSGPEATVRVTADHGNLDILSLIEREKLTVLDFEIDFGVDRSPLFSFTIDFTKALEEAVRSNQKEVIDFFVGKNDEIFGLSGPGWECFQPQLAHFMLYYACCFGNLEFAMLAIQKGGDIFWHEFGITTYDKAIEAGANEQLQDLLRWELDQNSGGSAFISPAGETR